MEKRIRINELRIAPKPKTQTPLRAVQVQRAAFSLGFKNNLRKAAPTQPKINTLIMSEVVRNLLLKKIIQRPLPKSTNPIIKKIIEVTIAGTSLRGKNLEYN